MGVSGQRHAPAALYLLERPLTHWLGGWVGTRVGLDAEPKEKSFCPCQQPNPGRQVRSQSLH
jgi:hypothetical protein